MRIRAWPLMAVLLVLALSAPFAPVLQGKVLSSAGVLQARDPAFGQQGPPSGGSPFRFDSAYVFEPDYRAARSQLLQGRLPLWTQGVGAGRPLLASQQHAVLFPLTAPALALPVDRGRAVSAWLKVVLAGVGMLLFLRACGLSPPSALLGAICFAAGAYFTSWLQHPQTNAFLLLPWLFWAAYRAARPDAGRLPWAGLALGMGGLWLAGHPQTAAMVTLATLAFYGFIGFPDWSRRGGAKKLFTFAGAAFCGLAIGAVMLWPFLDAVAQGVATDRGGKGGPPQILLSLLTPGFWGEASAADGGGGPINFPERTAYIGFIPLALAALTCWRPSRIERGLLVGTVALALLALDLHVGLETLPGLRSINMLRTLGIMSFCLAALAAFGLDRLIRQPEVSGRRLASVGAVIAIGSVVALCAGALDAGGFGDASAQGALTKLLLLAAGTAILGWAAALNRALPVLIAAAVAVTVLDLSGATAGYYRFLSPGDERLAQPEVVDALRQRDASRFAGESVLGPNLALRFGLDDARVHDHPAVGRYSRLWTGLVTGSPTIRTDFADRGRQTQKALNLFSVGSLVVGPGGSRYGERAVRSGVVEVRSNPTAFPRAFFVADWQPASGADRARQAVLASSSPALLRRPVIEGVAAPASRGAGSFRRATRIDTTAAQTDVVVRAPRAGYVVLTDTFFRGWTAQLDGRRVPIRAANSAFRAVRVPAGSHRVRFTYAPTFVNVSVGLSLLALLGVVLAAAGPVFARLRPSPAPSRLPVPTTYEIPSISQITRRLRSALGRADGLLRRVVGASSIPDGATGPHAPEPEDRGGGRSRVVWFALAAVAVGSVLGALVHPEPRNRFRAEAVVMVTGRDAREPERNASKASISDLMTLPPVRGAINRSARLAGETGPIEEVKVLGRSDARVVRVRAAASSPSRARVVADAAAGAAVRYNRRLAQISLASTGPIEYDFLSSLEGWQGRSRYSLPVRQIDRLGGPSRGLRFSCVIRRPGCGPGVLVPRTFDIGVSYSARVSIRGVRGRNPVRAVLGADSSDVAVGRAVRVARRNSARLVVRWVPRRSTSRATLALQTVGRTRLALEIASVDVRQSELPRLGRPSQLALARTARRKAVARAADADGVSVASRAVGVSSVSSNVAAWTFGGGLAGLLVALGGVAAYRAARRRQHEP